MDWLKKKKDEAKQAANQAAAKLQNKRSGGAFKGEGNVLGGGSKSGGDGATAPAPAPAASSAGAGKRFKVPFTTPAPPPISEEEKRQRREMQTKAAEMRVSAWDKRVSTARQARMQQEGAQENKYEPVAPPPPSQRTSSPSGSGDGGAAHHHRLLSDEEVRAREIQSAQAQLGFNPYAATFSSSNEAGSVMNSISTGDNGNAGTAPAMTMPPPAPVASPPATAWEEVGSLENDGGSGSGTAVYVLLRQEPARAIIAAETIIKMLNNILQNPSDDKFRRVRLANPGIQTKLVAVKGAIELLVEAGFTEVGVDNERVLLLAGDAFQVDRVRSVVDRTEVALMQLRVDSGQ